MEDAIVNNPEKFINENGLRLLARQYRVGSYIFDLLFEDRHGGKLIVEIQKGTLDRTHTYKILDYYHEYKEKNPRYFIDVMVIANIIPPERKRRLNDLGVDYKEVSESIFIIDQSENSEKTSETEHGPISLLDQNSKKIKMSENRIYFKSKGPSEFIKMTRDELIKVANNNWVISRGDGSLHAKPLPTIENIENKFGKGLIAQIWMERPNEKGYARCKFEVAYTISSLSILENKSLRHKIASSLRSFMTLNGLPKEIEEATGSTIIAIRINLSRVQNDYGHDMNETLDKNNILKIINFYRFLDEKLNEWNSRNSINLLYI